MRGGSVTGTTNVGHSSGMRVTRRKEVRMLSAFVSVAVMCAGCAIDEVSAVGARPWDVQAPLIDQQVQDGCARFALKVVNGVATVEALYNTNGCHTDALKLEADSSPVYDSTTGILRVPVVMRNLGTSPVVAPARIRFNADSSQFINAQGQVIAGTPNIVATNYDTANVSGRSGQWRYDTLLALSGQAQVLMPNAVSRRRWLEFSGSDWSQRIRIKLPTMATVTPAVPATAPDSTPAGWIADSAIVRPSTGFPYVRGYLLVGFQLGTSLSDRGRVIAQLSGTVVGGFLDPRSEGGLYLVRLPRDSTNNTLLLAESQLRSESVVRYFERVLIPRIDPTYRQPSEGAVYSSEVWRVAPTGLIAPSPYRYKWATEYVRAPLAWGCSVGDTTVHIGVVDQGIRTAGVTDLPSIIRSAKNTNLPGDTTRHGTRVLSVISSQGNNGVGISGMVWQSSVSLFDPTSLDSLQQPILNAAGGRVMLPVQTAQFAYLAALAGARVINISLGADQTPIVDLSDAAQVDGARRLMGQLAQGVAAPFLGQPTPLLVVSSGNVSLADPRVSLFPFLRDSLPASTIVVGAMRRDSTLYSAPVGSAYIDVVAPGEGVATWADTGPGITTMSGASFATPLVTGIAALLLAVDPTLNSDSLRYYIIQGAIESGRTVGGYPVVDAYSSLRLLAARPSAPLCGNRVWATNRAIQVERGSTVETLPVTLPSDSVWNVEVAHGGKQINYEFPGPYGLPTVGTVLWTAGGWVSGSSTEIPEADRSGASRSVYMRSHDADSLLSVQVSQTTASVDVEIALFDDAGLTQLRSTTISLPGLAPPPATDQEPTERVFVSGAYPQNGGDAVVAVNRMVAANSTGVTQCPNGASVTCQPGAIYYRYYWRPKQTDLYHVNVSSAPMTATHIATIPDSLVYDIAFSEDGKEKLLRMGRDSIYNSGDGVWELHSLVCKQSWSKPTFGTTSTTIPFDSTQARRIVDVFGCASDGPMLYRNGAGTSAPRVGPQRRVTANSG